jgi:hypothetical protein
MSMPIQRQSEQYGVFDDGPRFARDRSSTDLPKGLAGLINTTGPRIQAGLLNTREAAGYDFGRGPRDHGGHGPDGGPSVPDSYYNDDNDDNGDPEDPPGTPMEDPWGHHAGSRRPFDRTAGPRPDDSGFEYEPEMESALRKVYQYDPRFFQHKCTYPTRGMWDGYPTCAEDRAEGSEFCPEHKSRVDAAAKVCAVGI